MVAVHFHKSIQTAMFPLLLKYLLIDEFPSVAQKVQWHILPYDFAEG